MNWLDEFKEACLNHVSPNVLHRLLPHFTVGSYENILKTTAPWCGVKIEDRESGNG